MKVICEGYLMCNDILHETYKNCETKYESNFLLKSKRPQITFFNITWSCDPQFWNHYINLCSSLLSVAMMTTTSFYFNP